MSLSRCVAFQLSTYVSVAQPCRTDPIDYLARMLLPRSSLARTSRPDTCAWSLYIRRALRRYAKENLPESRSVSRSAFGLPSASSSAIGRGRTRDRRRSAG